MVMPYTPKPGWVWPTGGGFTFPGGGTGDVWGSETRLPIGPWPDSQGVANYMEHVGGFGKTKPGGTNAEGAPQFTPTLLDTSKYQPSDTLSKLKSEAFAKPGSSNWYKHSINQAGIEEAGLRDKLFGQSAGDLATQRGNLAMQGALSGGAAERMGRANMSDSLLRQQELARSGAARRTALGIQDEERQRALQTFLPGAELSQQQFGAVMDQFNVAMQNQAGRDNMMAQAYFNNTPGGGGGGGGPKWYENPGGYLKSRANAWDLGKYAANPGNAATDLLTNTFGMG